MSESQIFDLQRSVVSHMVSESWRNVPHVSYLYEPDITDFYKEFQALVKKKNGIGQKISLNTIMIRVIVEGLKSSPKLNALISYNHKKGKGILNTCNNINVSVPWLLSDGRMITPVILNTESMTLDDLSEAISKLEKKIGNTNIDELLYRAVFSDTVQELKRFHINIIVRILSSKLGFHRIRGLSGKDKTNYYKIPKNDRIIEQNLISGTVTISNIGSLYKEQKGYFGLLEIIPPQIFAVGLGAIQEKPGVYINEDGHKEIGIRKIIPMCLAFDHRAVDFVTLVPFLKRLDEIFSKSEMIHNW